MKSVLWLLLGTAMGGAEDTCSLVQNEPVTLFLGEPL
jgi:hypothetical protein